MPARITALAATAARSGLFALSKFKCVEESRPKKQSSKKGETMKVVASKSVLFHLVGVLSLTLIGLTTMTAHAATITVTGTGDTIAVDGLVTLREAITSANNNANVNGDVVAVGGYGTDTINFAISGGGVKTITLTAALPTITGVVTINGYTQGVATPNTLANGDNAVLLIELNGASAGAGTAKVGIAGLTLGSGSDGSTVRGLVINRFSGDGILVKSDGNTIAGNFLGINPAGTTGGTGLGNANTSFDLVTPFRAGIYVDNASSNTIGGTTPAARNVVGGNILDNIHLSGDAAGATANVVQGNFVGVNAAGTGILFTSGFFGIEVGGVNASGNTIGGTSAGSRNVVGGNGDGIELDDGAHDNIIQGNFAGVGADGVAATGNRLHGIALRDLGGSPGVSGNLIGGTVAGAGNTVANNGTAGVAVFGDPNVTPANVNNAILGNSIFNNGRSKPTSLLGIDLVSGTQFPTDDGNTPNDFGDGDAGPNNLQNYPVLTSAIPSGGGTTVTVTGTLNSRNNNGAGRTYRIEFFTSPAASQTGFGEGQTFLGFKEVTIGANPGPFVDQGQGTVSFTATLPPANLGDRITATATELIAGSGSTPLNTSEFSQAIEAGTPAISISDATATEGNSGTTVLTFTVSLSSASSQTVTVNYATADNTATVADNDYTAIPSTVLTFAPLEISKTVTVNVTGDTTTEPDETFIVHLSGATNATITDADGIGTIQNDDATPSISINDVSLAEGDTGTTTFAFTLTLSAPSSQTVTVNFATADGTATAGSDYASNSGTVIFNALETSKTINVTVNGDTKNESNETFFVNLSSSSNATIADNQGLGTILNDDTPGFQFEQASYTVSETGPSISIVVKRTGDPSIAATVDYATNDFTGVPTNDLQPALCNIVNGNASAKCDYATAGGRLRFAATETSKTIVLSIVDDVFLEGDETLSVTLSNQSTGNLVSPATTVITIQDNDTNPNPSNPYLLNAFFVRQQYLDFLLREPDSAGFNDWLNVLNNCQPNQGFLGAPPECDRVQVSSGFFRSPEFGERGYWIFRFFIASLGRRPLFAEFTPEMRRLSGLKSQADLDADEADFINEFMQRQEFITIYNGVTDAAHASEFISRLEQTAGVTLPATVPPTQPGQPTQYNRQDLINLMQSGQFTTAQTLRAFIEQKVVWDAYFFKAFVAMEYFGYLRRDPENAGYDDWVDVLINGRSSAGIAPGDFRHLVFGFIYSEEYRERFGPK
jgi:hypothetical protein